MSDFYVGLIRIIWLGSVWSGAYIVRPVLGHLGFFPLHGLEVIHWIMGGGVVWAGLSVSLMYLQRTAGWKDRSLQLVVAMLILSVLYFGFMPWWKLQMMLVHSVAALGFLWVWLDRRSE